MLPRTDSGIRSGLYIRLKGIGGASGGCGPINDTNPKNGREPSDFAISSIARSATHHCAQADGTSLHCATAFRNRHLRPMDKYEIFRFQTCDIQGATSLEPDTVR